MTNQFYIGQTTHHRFSPKRHLFSYPVLFVSYNLSELQNCRGRFFSYNKLGVFSIQEKDYLYRGPGSIKEKVDRLLTDIGHKKLPRNVQLITSPRYFNYVFNPVSFYYCYDDNNDLYTVIAEVTNTYKETHVYVLDQPLDSLNSKQSCFSIDKEFHVSPFFDEEGTYDFSFSPIDTTIAISITYYKKGKKIFFANLTGAAKAISNLNLLKIMFKYPLTLALTMPRILWQAFILHYIKKITVRSKPIPVSEYTLRKWTPSLFEKLCMYGVCKLFSKASSSSLVLRLPDTTCRQFGDPNYSGEPVTVNVRDYRFFVRAALYGEIGVGESYMHGEWDTKKVRDLICFFIDNKELISNKNDMGNRLLYGLNKWRHKRRENTLEQSKQNIQEHYDLSNDFYRQFLCKHMMYSSALYTETSKSLEEAQLDKINRLIETLDVSKDHQVLEIGSGWGTVAIEIAKRTGASVTTLTLSQAQFDYVDARIKREDLTESVTVKLCDYRDIKGVFDRIISVEMLEAVGHKYLPVFFNTCDQLLVEGGRMVLQTITIPHDRYHRYRKQTDWIKKHIFPGGHLPSTDHIKSLIEHTRLRIDDTFEIGLSYAKTLAEWRRRFNLNWDRIVPLGFNDIFRRKWNYYLSYCEGAFHKSYIGNSQILFVKESDR